MGLETFIEFVTTQGIWCALFIWLFFSNRQDSKEREQRLMDCLEAQKEGLKEIADTLDRVMDMLSEKK